MIFGRDPQTMTPDEIKRMNAPLKTLGRRICPICRRVLNLSRTNFHRVRPRSTRFRDMCIECEMTRLGEETAA